MKIIAAILAGGSGKRMQTDLPKQFQKLAGKPVLQYSMEAFAAISEVDVIIIVTHPDYKDEIPINEIPLTIPIHVIPGGSSRNISSLQAIEFAKSKFNEDEAAILFHDAARPNIKTGVIKRIIERIKSDTSEVVVAISPVTDTLYSLDNNYNFENVIDRSKTFKAHTPQAFKLTVIDEAYRKKQALGKTDFSDDVSIVNYYLPNTKIDFVQDSYLNMKISYPGDLEIMEGVMKLKNE